MSAARASGMLVAVLLDLLRLGLGVALLLAGAYVLLRGSIAIALGFGISRVVIGATIVAFGTSAPELVVTITAGLRGSSEVAFGNVLGSNVANVLLVLGLAAVINPTLVHTRLIRWEIPVLLGATAATVLFALGGGLSRIEGVAMLAALAAFVYVSPRLFPEVAEAAEAEEASHPPPARMSGRRLATDAALILGGLVALAVGADQIVAAATSMAKQFGVSEFVVGVLIVAVGTSLPEIATSILAAFKNEHEIAVANVVGSNIFNLLGVAGAAAVVTGLPAPGVLYQFEFPVLLLSAAVLVPLAWPRYRIPRREGAALLVAYAAFVAVTVLRG
ncbi:MAG: calcium/sodium antiporter [Dehalococcoidia bacterium]